MSAIESDGQVQDVVRPVATVTALPSRATPDLAPLPIPTRAQIFALICPPDVWSDDRPSLKKLWLYSVYGRWTDTKGFWRWAGIAYSIPAMLVTTVFYVGAWVVERPARAFIAAAIYELIKLAF